MARKKDLNRREHRVAPTELPHDLLKEPVRRRAWLLEKALEAYPLDRALELARAAEDFITQSRTDPGDETSEPHIKTVAEGRRSGLSISAEQREQVLQRLAEGATNAELAGPFGLSRRQVQGIRMGSSAQIAARRGRGE